MLKARPSAGDLELGQAFVDMVAPLVWSAAERENFVSDSQAMRKRVVAHIPARDAGRELKLGEGGLRDVEFSVQILQLVHGRADERLRRRRDAGSPAAADRRRLRRARGRQGVRAGVPVPADARAPDPALPAAAHPRAAGGRGGSAPSRPFVRLRAIRPSSCCPSGDPAPARSAGCTSGCSTHRCSTRWPGSRPRSCGSPPRRRRTG